MKISIYITIFNRLYDGNWHNKSEFCREWSADLRRLEEMHHPHHWVDYEQRDVRKDGKIIYTEYRLTKIYDCFWEYYKRFDIVKPARVGEQVEFAI